MPQHCCDFTMQLDLFKQSSISSNYIRTFVNQSPPPSLWLAAVFTKTLILFASLHHVWITARDASTLIMKQYHVYFSGNKWFPITLVTYQIILTWRARADIDHLALGARHMFVLYHECDRLHEYSVLCPGLQAGQQDSGVWVFVWSKLHIHHVPAVGATAILPLKLCYVLVRPGRKAIKVQRFKTDTDWCEDVCEMLKRGRPCSNWYTMCDKYGRNCDIY